jgi:hypothetical protein
MGLVRRDVSAHFFLLVQPPGPCPEVSCGSGYDVAVVGYGPTGLTAASLLGRLGHRVVGVDAGRAHRVCMTLIRDSGSGARRAKCLGLFVLAAVLVMVSFLSRSGLLDAASWRMPFWIYLVPLLVVPMARRL